jgi:hypothetical protein
VAVFAVGLLANAAIASWLYAEVRLWRPLKSLSFDSASSNESHAYALKFGHGHVELDFALPGPEGDMEVHSFHLHY